MLGLEIGVNTKASWVVQGRNRDGSIPSQFTGSEALSASVWPGQDQPAVFAPMASWSQASTCQIALSISAAQSALLTPGGTYELVVYATPSGQDPSEVVWCTLAALPTPGTGTQAVVPYCTLRDVLDVAPWVRMVQQETDTEGFYGQRLQARQWMDQAILNCYRGAFVGLFETHSTAAFSFGYAGWRRSLGPSPSLITYLEQDLLLVKPYIVRACAHWTAHLIGLSQIGINNAWANMGCYHRDEAERRMTGITAEVDLNGDGIGELFISLDSTNTLFT